MIFLLICRLGSARVISLAPKSNLPRIEADAGRVSDWAMLERIGVLSNVVHDRVQAQ